MPGGGMDAVVAAVSCYPPWGDPSLHAIVGVDDLDTRNHGFTDADVTCILAAGSDCAAVRACLGVSAQLSGATCTMHTVSCSGSTAVECFPAHELDPTSPAQVGQQDCSRNGSCDPTSGCVQRSCFSGPATCVDQHTVMHTCTPDGTMLETCTDGDTCQTMGVFAGCEGTGPDCAQDSCSGSAVLACDTRVNRQYAPFDCATIGGHCTLDAVGNASCAPNSTTCNPDTTSADCAAGQLRWCGRDGEFHRYDCEHHGFGTCEEVPQLTGGVRCGPTGDRLW